MKDQMGMDFGACYEEAAKPAGGVLCKLSKLQLIGVKTAKVRSRKLTGQIVTLGAWPYDPTSMLARRIPAAVRARMASHRGGRKLQLMGMSQNEIAEMEKGGKPEEGLYLPQADQKNVWVIWTVYEYEAGYVKEGQSIEVTAGAYPAKFSKARSSR